MNDLSAVEFQDLDQLYRCQLTISEAVHCLNGVTPKVKSTNEWRDALMSLRSASATCEAMHQSLACGWRGGVS